MKISLLLVSISIVLLGVFFTLEDVQEDRCYGYRGKTVTEAVYSLSVKDTFKIVLYLPESYNDTDSRRYPVIYQLDGNYYGKTTAILMAHFKCREFVPQEAVIVSIGYYYDGWFDKRERDYICVDSVNLSASFPGNMRFKGLNFFYFLKNELIPYVDSHFKTDNSTPGRTLMGHSLGGYFTLFTLFYQYLAMENDKEPPLFRNFIAASPVVVDQFRLLLVMEKKLRNRAFTSFPICVFIGTSDREEMTEIKYIPYLAQRLEAWRFPGFRPGFLTLKNLRHPKTAVPTFKEGLRFVFNPPVD